MIRGLHTCKPGNTPSVGQVKTFMLLSMGEGDRTWTKIKSEKPDKGGRHYRILSVEKTDYSDAHGNVSFNLELEEAQAPAGSPSPPPQNGAPPQSSAAVSHPPQQPQQYDTAEQFVIRSANLYNLCLGVADTVIRERMQSRNIDLHEHPAWFQAIVTTLFINAKDQGYIAHMSDKEQKPPVTKRDPY